MRLIFGEDVHYRIARDGFMGVGSLWPLPFGMCCAAMASTPPKGVSGSIARQLSVPAPFTLILLCE